MSERRSLRHQMDLLIPEPWQLPSSCKLWWMASHPCDRQSDIRQSSPRTGWTMCSDDTRRCSYSDDTRFVHFCCISAMLSDHTHRPPSTGISMPVMKAASSLARYAQALATSSGVLPRPNGTVARNVFSFSGLPRKAFDLSIVVSDRSAVRAHHIQSSAQAYDRADTVETYFVLGILDSQGARGIDDSSLRGVVPSQSWSRSNASC